MKPLWLTPERRNRLAAARNTDADWLRPMIAAAGKAENTCYSHEAVVRMALDAVLRDNADVARRALDLWVEEAGQSSLAEDLHKGTLGVVGALLADSAQGLWNDEDWGNFRAAARVLAGAFFAVSKGNPHAVANNWWAVSHSGLYAIACALDACEDFAPVCGRTPGDLAEWAWGRLHAFLGHFGPGGAYHEGLGYMGYACGHLLPAVLLHETLTGKRVTDTAPGLTRMAGLIFRASLQGAVLSDETGKRGGWGRMLSWNDAGLGFLQGSAPLLAACLAPPDHRRTLRDQWDHLAGHLRPDGAVDEFCGALFFHAVFYSEAGAGHTKPLPLGGVDPLHGLWIARNRWRDKDDAVAGALARGYHPGGHRQHDAGSIRFSAGGWDWILGGGQARAEARWQSRLVPSDHDDSAPAACGRHFFADDDCTVFGIDLRAVHRAYSERYVALRSNPDQAQLAVLDLVNDHRTDRHWLWCLTFSPELECTLLGDRFLLAAPDGQSLEAAFLLDKPDSITLTVSPPSHRKFVSGKVVNYPGRPCMIACFGGPSLKILVSFALNATPARLSRPDALDIAFGDDLWERPFGTAFPAVTGSFLQGQCQSPCRGNI
ncbi:MAG: hypothetical protein Fur0032_06050 [Terrimicrobiaceae bacterium]